VAVLPLGQPVHPAAILTPTRPEGELASLYKDWKREGMVCWIGHCRQHASLFEKGAPKRKRKSENGPKKKEKRLLRTVLRTGMSFSILCSMWQ